MTEQMNATVNAAKAERRLTFNKYLGIVFSWMFVGLIVTFVTAYQISLSPVAAFLQSNIAIALGLTIAQVLLVAFFLLAIPHISVVAAIGLFVAYSLLTGVTFSSIFITFEVASVINVFLFAAVFFGGMAGIGLFTKINLSETRGMLNCALSFVLLQGIVLIIFPSPAMEKVLCWLGLIIFAGYTAVDVQQIKKVYAHFKNDDKQLANHAILSALELYLDFVNIFIRLLSILGNKKD